jgi:hypothetical protein
LFLAGLLWFDRHGPFERILYAGFFGVMVQVLGLMAYIFVTYFAERLAGLEPSDPRALDVADPKVIGAVLLAAIVYMAGQHWKREQALTIKECVREHSGDVPGEFGTIASLIDYCIEEYGVADDYD